MISIFFFINVHLFTNKQKTKPTNNINRTTIYFNLFARLLSSHLSCGLGFGFGFILLFRWTTKSIYERSKFRDIFNAFGIRESITVFWFPRQKKLYCVYWFQWFFFSQTFSCEASFLLIFLQNHCHWIFIFYKIANVSRWMCIDTFWIELSGIPFFFSLQIKIDSIDCIQSHTDGTLSMLSISN